MPHMAVEPENFIRYLGWMRTACEQDFFCCPGTERFFARHAFELAKFGVPDWETKYSVVNHTKEFVYEYRA